METSQNTYGLSGDPTGGGRLAATFEAGTSLSVETVEELGERWRLSRSRIYELLGQGLPSVKLGRARRFITSDVDAWLLAHVDRQAAA
jgi:excisionase family DNA binding protein